MLRAVFFDVGNTLLTPYPSVSQVCREVLAEQGHQRDLASIDSIMPLVDQYYEDRYREDDTFWTDEARTSAVWVGMYSLLCRRLGVEADAECIARRVYDEFGRHERWQAFRDVTPALDRLKERGLLVGLISNWDRRLERLIEGLGLGEKVDTVVCSADVGLRKPDPRIFELGCERLGVDPAECAHVGDHGYADVEGARSVGMMPVLIDRVGCGESRHVACIRTLDDLETVLGME